MGWANGWADMKMVGSTIMAILTNPGKGCTRKSTYNPRDTLSGVERLMIRFDPYDNVDEEQKSQVLGGQASLWSEQTDETNLESVMWPRAAAVAELFWTGAGPEGYPRSTSPHLS